MHRMGLGLRLIIPGVLIAAFGGFTMLSPDEHGLGWRFLAGGLAMIAIGVYFLARTARQPQVPHGDNQA
jgi:hypothetical protein